MSQRPSAAARALAVIALIGGFAVLLIVVVASLNGDDGGGANRPARGGAAVERKAAKPRSTYVVQDGDTLTAIARKTGVSVARIQALNPGIDPQILVSGQKLTLR